MTSMTASADVARWVVAPRRIAWGGIALAALGLWLVLPPVESRSAVWPLAFGAVALAAGAWAALEGERKLGWGAVGVAALCALLGWGATQSSVAHLDGAHTTSSG